MRVAAMLESPGLGISPWKHTSGVNPEPPIANGTLTKKKNHQLNHVEMNIDIDDENL